MLSLLADSTSTSLLIALPAVAAIIGAAIALMKLGGERDSLAVAQAQGAMETMDDLNQALERALERSEARAAFYKTQYRKVVAERNELVARWGPFPDHAAVVDVLDDPETG